jgi:hypothetical protein
MRLAAMCLTAALAALLSTAHAEERAAFVKRVSKYATDDPAHPKSLCHCHDQYDTTGYVVMDAPGTTVNVSCRIPTYDYTNGQFIEYITCAVAWDTLGK